MNEQITLKLASLINNGMEVRAAWETVFGAGSWEKMAGEMHDALRAKANAA